MLSDNRHSYTKAAVAGSMILGASTVSKHGRYRGLRVAPTTRTTFMCVALLAGRYLINPTVGRAERVESDPNRTITLRDAVIIVSESSCSGKWLSALLFRAQTDQPDWTSNEAAGVDYACR